MATSTKDMTGLGGLLRRMINDSKRLYKVKECDLGYENNKSFRGIF